MWRLFLLLLLIHHDLQTQHAKKVSSLSACCCLLAQLCGVYLQKGGLTNSFTIVRVGKDFTFKGTLIETEDCSVIPKQLTYHQPGYEA